MNSFRISVKDWVQNTWAIGLRATAGRFCSMWAFPDIAFEFAMWTTEGRAALVRARRT